jgi:hypothetical protein
MNLSNTLEFGKLTEYELDSLAHPGIGINIDSIVADFDIADTYRQEELATTSLLFGFLGGNRGCFGGYTEPIRVVGCDGVRELLGSGSPDGTTKYASATRIAVKPCACGAPLRGCGA